MVLKNKIKYRRFHIKARSLTFLEKSEDLVAPVLLLYRDTIVCPLNQGCPLLGGQ